MKKKITYCLILVFLMLYLSNVPAFGGKKTITFPSEDGLQITADVYMMYENRETPFIVLFHRAGWSRGEYLKIAPKLNRIGFNCMAVDQRSGSEVNGVMNKTAMLAKTQGRDTTYIDAMPDIESALKHVRNHYGRGRVIAWGSSYSAALVLKIAGDRPELVDGVLAFSPGEYFAREGKSSTWISRSAKNIQCPVFITSAREEKEAWFPIFKAIRSSDKHYYLPSTRGNHGSCALWGQFRDSEGYWRAVEDFLAGNFKTQDLSLSACNLSACGHARAGAQTNHQGRQHGYIQITN